MLYPDWHSNIGIKLEWIVYVATGNIQSEYVIFEAI